MHLTRDVSFPSMTHATCCERRPDHQVVLARECQLPRIGRQAADLAIRREREAWLARSAAPSTDYRPRGSANSRASQGGRRGAADLAIRREREAWLARSAAPSTDYRPRGSWHSRASQGGRRGAADLAIRREREAWLARSAAPSTDYRSRGSVNSRAPRAAGSGKRG